jgi:hypothetical protein
MDKKPLFPINIVESEGNLSYNESNQSWGTIRLKSEIINEFRQLREKRSKFSYKILYHRDPKELERMVKKLTRDNMKVMPFLLFLYKEL